MIDDFAAAHNYFKLVFSGKNPMTKKYEVKDFPNINKLIVKNNSKKIKDSKKCQK